MCILNAPERLFVHQTGDEFAIVSDCGASSLERPVAIDHTRPMVPSPCHSSAGLPLGMKCVHQEA